MSETGRVLKPANENPWYVLMTLYGEQDGEEIDWALHEKNRAAWNIVVGRMLPDRLRDVMDVNGMHMPARDVWHQSGAALRTLHKKTWVLRNKKKEHEYPGFFEIDGGLVIDLSSLDFRHRVVARGFAFSFELSFRYSEFGGTAHFESAIFARNCDYTSTQFQRNCYFHKTAFFGDANFQNANLKFAVSFRNCIFEKSTIFMSSTFCREADFSYAEFRDEALFSSTDFNSDASFSFAKFSNTAVFHHAIIRNDAWFNSTVFHSPAWFQFSTFLKMISFDSSVFEADARFDDVAFNGNANFCTASFNGFVDFAQAYFGSEQGTRYVAFKDAQFKKPANFRGVRFSNSYPDFSGAVLHDKTTFIAKPEFWPQDPQPNPEQAKASCAVIRHNLGKQGLPEEEHFFFRREMGFAAQIGPWWQKLPYQLFGMFSGFGYSIVLPLAWLGFFWALGGVGFWHVFAQKVGVWAGLGKAMVLGFANMFQVFGFTRMAFYTEWMGELPTVLKVYAGAQTVVALPLLFFFALGLRTRFRMR